MTLFENEKVLMESQGGGLVLTNERACHNQQR